MNRKSIPLTKTPCKDAFRIFLKNRKKSSVIYNQEQEKFLWRVWRIAWVFGKQYGAIQEEKIHCKPLLTNREMKKIWDSTNPMTGREFGKRIEMYYGIRKHINEWEKNT